jgi:hypothetical protein
VQVTCRNVQVTSRNLQVASKIYKLTSRNVLDTSRNLQATSRNLQITRRNLQNTTKNLQVTRDKITFLYSDLQNNDSIIVITNVLAYYRIDIFSNKSSPKPTCNRLVCLSVTDTSVLVLYLLSYLSSK